ncbi:MAG: hypothetical protein GC154_13030 [bacterium]|nr:hypothetical protein [bacterium]
MNPIILAHGFIGFRRFLIWRHFDGVADALRQAGYEVFQPLVHPTETIPVRAGQLDAAIRARYGDSQPVHIVAHSMGGLDSRYMASPGGLNQGHRIATITTLGTPHYGSPVADAIPEALIPVFCGGAWLLGRLPLDPDSRELARRIGERRFDGLRQLRTRYIQEAFNPATPDHPGVYYQSYAGSLMNRPGLRYIPWRFLKNRAGENDGLVPVESARWGVWRGVIEADHGGLVGLRIFPFIKTRNDYIAFFLNLAQELAEWERQPSESSQSA